MAKDFLGLTNEEVRALQLTDGYNELPSQKQQNGLELFIKVVSEPMLLLLVITGVIYFFLGDIRDTLMLSVTIFVIVGITYYQERKTEKTLEALKQIASPKSTVIRNGKEIKIESREIVRGDFVVMREGDRVSADGVILSCQNLSVDESLLTGESLPVRKQIWNGKLSEGRPGGDDMPFVYSGTLVVSGRGIFQVRSIGVGTQIGQIGRSLEDIKPEETLLKKETSRVVKIMAALALFLCIFVVALNYFMYQDFVGGLISGLTLAMSLLPEEFSVILVIFITLGSWRLSRRRVLTRHAQAIETLGAATVLCTDKTGTLTSNKISLRTIYCNGKSFEIKSSSKLTGDFLRVIELGLLASQKDQVDPIEKDLYFFGEKHLPVSALHKNWLLVKEYPFTKDLMAVSYVYEDPKSENLVVATKGAPEAIVSLCRLNKNQSKKILSVVSEMSVDGLRVLGVAKAKVKNNKLANTQAGFDFEFVGLLGFLDAPRNTAAKSIKEAYSAGLRVLMITGDYPGTAQYIGQELNITNSDNFLTGEELEYLPLKSLQEKIKSVNIFARVLPEQKLMIVNALKKNGEIVAMTGDGVNDAPALKSAHIGIAMGDRGTDVAREASDLILLNDDFSSIVAAVRQGRAIYDNLKRAMTYAIAVHVPIAGLALFPLVFGMPLILFPAHIAFLELIIDPACASVFESVKEDDDIMRRPPRPLSEKLFSVKTVLNGIFQGLGIFISVYGFYLYLNLAGRPESEIRGLSFALLVVINLLLIAVDLTWKRGLRQLFAVASKAFYVVVFGASIMLFIVTRVPFFASLFHMSTIQPHDYLLLITPIVFCFIWFSSIRFISSR